MTEPARNDLTMNCIVHDASSGAIDGPASAVTGNTYASRPTRNDPQGCDSCGKPAGHFDLCHTTTAFPFAELPSKVCMDCADLYPDGVPREVRINWILKRASRFGQQWHDAVRAQLGWP